MRVVVCGGVWCCRWLTFLALAEPEKQFALVRRHIDAIRRRSEFVDSEIVVMVEHNLGL